MNVLNIKTQLYKHITKTKSFVTPSFYEYLFNDPILLYYSDFSKNWGDFINPFLVEKITKQKTVSYKRIYNIKNKQKLFGVGSILHHSGLENSVIWGSGFIHSPKNINGIPAEILALRGKKSAEIFQKFNVKHNGLYGDPALLFPSFYKPGRALKYKVGIIPHYSELEAFQSSETLRQNDEITIISPMVKEDKVYQIIDQICECEIIISSSLHGLILADAYQRPSLRFNFSNKLVGGDFKFNDYYSGIGINTHQTIQIDDVDNINFLSIYNNSSTKDLKFDEKKLASSLIEYYNS